MLSATILLGMPFLTTLTEVKPPKDRVAAMISRRAQMPTAYALEYRIEAKSPGAKPPIDSEWGYSIRLWRSGNKFRVDQYDAHYTPPRAGHDPQNRQITCENCEREGYGVVTTILPGLPRSLHKVEFRRLEASNLDYYQANFDWRFFGLSNVKQMSYKSTHVSSFLSAFFVRPDVSGRADRRGGLPCLVGSGVKDTSTQVIWFSEQDDFSPVHFDYHADAGRGPEGQTTSVEWQTIAGGRHYPSRVTFRHEMKGTLDYEEVVAITRADFTSPVDPAVFTLAGFGLNEGQIIGIPDVGLNDLPHWRNGEIDYSDTLASRRAAAGKSPPTAANRGEGPVAPYPAQRDWPLVVGVASGLISIVAAVFAIVHRRRRAPA